MSQNQVGVTPTLRKNKNNKTSNGEDVEEGQSEPSPGMESDATYDSDENAFFA